MIIVSMYVLCFDDVKVSFRLKGAGYQSISINYISIAPIWDCFLDFAVEH